MGLLLLLHRWARWASSYYTVGQDGLLTQVGKMGFSFLLHRWARWAYYCTGGQDGIIIITQVGKMGLLLLHRWARWASACYFTGGYDGLLLLIAQVGMMGIEASWAGGEKGREVMDRFLPHVHQLLSPRGLFYLIIIKENIAG